MAKIIDNLKEQLLENKTVEQTKLSQLEELLTVQELKKHSLLTHQELKKLKLLDMVKLEELNYTTYVIVKVKQLKLNKKSNFSKKLFQ